ncbi:MAG: amino acid permease [Betaproteobacteria bacterium]|jgi:amino acid transporter
MSDVNATPKITPITNEPAHSLRTIDITSLIVGTILGAGIFKVPSLVAGQLHSEPMILIAWLLGGLISLVGALCYVELATSFPNVGGEYFFLQKAYGKKIAFLYGWARSVIIVTGSIALLGITLGDYMSKIWPLGLYSSTVWAMLVVIGLSLLNCLGIKEGKTAQNILTIFEVGGVIAIIATGFMADSAPSIVQVTQTTPELGALSLAMVFVLLTYGGWNEAAYISAEAIDQKRGILKGLVLGLGLVTILYVLVNLSYFHAFGAQGMGQSNALASDLFELAYGHGSAVIFSAIVVFSCLNSINATIIFGSRSSFALGKDWKILSWIAEWHDSGTPRKAILLQCVISLLLIFGAAFVRQGFESIVEFTAPVFWFFIMLVGLSLFILRKRYPNTHRPFSIPMYPILPLIFTMTSGWLLWSSLAYSGIGALVGVGFLGLGAIALLFEKK